MLRRTLSANPTLPVTETRLSVILPVWNRAASIGRAIASIRGDYRGPVELIVVDDGSTDDSAARAQAALAAAGFSDGRVIRQANAGPGAARNAGVAAANGEYLAFIDSDDYWFPWTLSACMAALDGDSGSPAFVFLQTVDVAPDRPLIELDSGAGMERRVFSGFLAAVSGHEGLRYATCNVVIHRRVLEALGGFAEAAETSEDTDLFLRAARMGPCILVTGKPLVAHELERGDNLTSNFSRVQNGLRFLMAEYRSGRYPEPDGGPLLRDQVLAKSVAHAALVGFATGHPGGAYALLFRYGRQLQRGGQWHWLVRLPFLPLLAYLKPSSYRFRWHAVLSQSGLPQIRGQ